jgi:hypothetical protein
MTQAVVTAQHGGADYSGTFRNKIINGDMRIDQRNAGATTTPTTNVTYTLDRWVTYLAQSSKFSTGQSSNAPAGFKTSVLATSLSAYTVASGEVFGYTQMIEGYNVADFAWGTASAKTVTLSFWVYSSLTGTFGGAFKNGAEDRAYAFTYTVSSANTWTYITLSIPGDTSGTWLTTNGIGLKVVFSLGCGSTMSTTSGSWTTGNYFSATGALSVIATNTATWQITGVQLEVGTQATPFERRPFGMELALCQRYYIKSYNIETAPGTNQSGAGIGNTSYRNQDYSNSRSTFSSPVYFPVQMRATPTVTIYSLPGTSGNYSVGSQANFNDGTGSAAATTIYSTGTRGFAGVETGGINAGQFFNFHYTAVSEL